ncbi:hypothetical protein GOP47_0004789 [Adiantum capillus-veneris]|uniref:Uncharacterized protein n=1 Tax=Adiantum capillus-veneris TaxID=13818 RepID=A0A9D4V4G7_ADICA|nr:hypothetical protein GOP47_0004789 [Adiantum capillus-veneris]
MAFTTTCISLMLPSSTSLSSGRSTGAVPSGSGSTRLRLVPVSCSSKEHSSKPAAEATPSLAESTSEQRKEPRPETGDRSLRSLFAFDGAAPESINGRMAMVGFVWALAAEKLTGLSVMEQLFNPATSGLLWFAAAVQLFTLASVIPLAKGESTDTRRWGPFNTQAERWNGRLAMIGFAALIVDEMIRQAPLIYQ